jgi:hypothetical protein
VGNRVGWQSRDPIRPHLVWPGEQMRSSRSKSCHPSGVVGCAIGRLFALREQLRGAPGRMVAIPGDVPDSPHLPHRTIICVGLQLP